jgi:hypothetical protein
MVDAHAKKTLSSNMSQYSMKSQLSGIVTGTAAEAASSRVVYEKITSQ